jgi:hypothetical protein
LTFINSGTCDQRGPKYTFSFPKDEESGSGTPTESSRGSPAVLLTYPEEERKKSDEEEEDDEEGHATMEKSTTIHTENIMEYRARLEAAAVEAEAVRLEALREASALSVQSVVCLHSVRTEVQRRAAPASPSAVRGIVFVCVEGVI